MVTYWYAQNMLLFVDERSLAEYAGLAAMDRGAGVPLPLVHPLPYTGLATHKFLLLHHLFYFWRKFRSAKRLDDRDGALSFALIDEISGHHVNLTDCIACRRVARER
jgi:hypothetical protein